MKESSLTTLPTDYKDWLIQLKSRIQGARQQALLAANQTQIRLYHEIGREILERQEQQGWGAKVIDRLSADLREAFPDMKGFSRRNLIYMMKFAQCCPGMQFVQRSAAQLSDLQFGQQSAAQLPWFHMLCRVSKSQWALRSINLSVLCRNHWTLACRRLKKLKRHYPIKPARWQSLTSRHVIENSLRVRKV